MPCEMKLTASSRRHVLLLEEIGGMALALGEDGDEHIGAGDLLAARGLDVDDGALDDALESGGRPRVLAVGHDEAVELLVDEFLEIGLEGVDVDVAPGQHRDGVAVVGQRQQQMLQRGEFMAALARQIHRLSAGLFRVRGKMRAWSLILLFFHDALQRMLVLACGIHHHASPWFRRLRTDRPRTHPTPFCGHAS